MGQAKDTTDLLLEPLTRRSNRYYLLVSVLLAISGWGVYAYAVQVTSGIGVLGVRSEVMWGVYITNFVFFIGISHVGALMSAILRLTGADWRKPITRLAEVVTFASLCAALTWPIAHLGRPDRWFNLLIYPKLQSPLVWDLLCIGTYTIGSTIFLYLPLIPDIAKCRDRLTNVSRFRRWIYSVLSLGWSGSEYEMKQLEKAIGIMTILIIPIAISVHTIVSWDFAMQLRTGWDSTIFGPYFVAGALLSGVATVLLVMAALTKFDHLDAFITRKHFDYIATLLLALDVVLIYFTINEYMVPGYKVLGQNTLEGQWLSSLLWGIYWPRFWFQIIAGLIVPAIILAVPRTRTITGYLVAALLIDIGMWVERFNIVVPSLALPQLPYAWGLYSPTWVEISTTAASFAGVALVYLVFTRTFPIITIWENVDQTTDMEVSKEIHSAPTRTLIGRSDSSVDSRRHFLSYGAMMAAGFMLGSVSPNIATAVIGDVKRNSTDAYVPISTLGESVSINDVGSAVKFQVEKPLRIPMGSSLDNVRVGNNGELVALLYVNPTVPTISMYASGVGFAILEMVDPKPDAPPSYLPNGFKRVKVNLNSGFGREASGEEFDNRDEPGQLQWWQGGVHFVILANLPIEQLKEIAESMEPI
ncbi:MAG TPA: NrfD/PsrC family molybdoenzyme membrane anchor subunit [Candidatus Bathyarchaeia archaeon]|nr:NrfD/PsrC family molybdoenzyme membrane anchor subunit [Candidatus Bathyarchaeia archaeon]